MKCPSCKNQVVMENGLPECKFCGAHARINPDNGYIEWMKDGRVFLNEQLEKEVWEAWKNAYTEQFEQAEKEGKGPRTEESI